MRALSYYGHLMAEETSATTGDSVEANGKDPNPYRLAFVQFIGVGDTDAEAYRLYKEPAEYFFNRSLHVYAGYADPPGYVTEASVRARYKSQVRADRPHETGRSTTSRGTRWSRRATSSSGAPTRCARRSKTSRRRSTAATCSPMLQFGNMSDELTRYNTKLFGDKVAPATAHDLRRRGRPLVARERDGRLMAGERDLLYLFGIAGHPAPSPLIAHARSRRVERRRPSHQGVRRRARDFVARRRLPRLAHGPVWDAIDASGVRLPCPVVGASVGGMLAVDLAALSARGRDAHSPCSRPSASSTTPTKASTSTPCPTPDRMEHLFAKGVPEPFVDRFSELGPDDGPVARYLSDVAAANLLWPLGDRGQASRLHRIRCPRLSLWGEQDELLPPGVSARRVEGGVPAEVIDGAGHLLEWDVPDQVGARVVAFLRDAQ